MTLYGNLADSVKWLLCEFVSARPVGGDSNIEYDFALEIIQMVKEQIARDVLDWCLSQKHDVEDQDVPNSPFAVCSDCKELSAAIARGK